MKRVPSRDVPDDRPEYCPPPSTVDAMLLLQERWVLFVVHALLAGPLGFNELNRRATGVSAATLSQRLVLLEQRGILTKRVLSTMPPRTEYRLTRKGAGLRPVIDAISAWAQTPDP
jgi:DNA-binding HxlR family transcriptional regulator